LSLAILPTTCFSQIRPVQVPTGFYHDWLFKTGSGGQTFEKIPAFLCQWRAFGGGFTINPGFLPWIKLEPDLWLS